ncbi:SurA N-terminal domain-containing protein [Benzoatithermus flavus]|uniref:Parvulin-like PPIase n=1 Tax=Benzoatithermus flavus TaxID=3108223 RepID=A0ABU8XK19_9PROT
MQRNHGGSSSMLDALRTHATGPVAKVLFGILVVSFAIWGIGDIFRAPHGGGSLARVDGTDITAREVTNEFENRWRQLQQQFGNNLDRRAAVSLGLMNEALEAAIARRLVDAHAHDLKLTVADETIAAQIRDNPSFQGTSGFDRQTFQMFLRSIGLSEQDYVAALRAEMIRDRLIDAMTGPLAVPGTLVRKLVEYRQEQRRGKALVVNAGDIQVEAPGEEALQAYLDEHVKDYEAPEYRDVTLLVLRPEDLLNEIEVSDADVRAAYDSRAAQYKKPEQRKLEQLLANDEATIRRAAEMVASGQSFAAVAEALKGAGVERSELGPLAEGDLPEALEQPVWSLPEGGVSQPVQTPFGWHLVRVTQIRPEETQPFDAVKDEIRRELALERASNQLPDLATKLDDEIAAGTPIDEAGRKLGIEVLKLQKIDRTGHSPAKERLAADRLTGEMLNTIFAARQGETSLLEQTPDGRYYMYRVDAVEPARPRTLAEVRDEVAKAWTATEQRKRARAKAEELSKQATSPASLDQLAQGEKGVEIVAIGPVIRSDDAALLGLNGDAVHALFATEPGKVAGSVVDVPKGSAIVATEEIVPAKPEPALLNATETLVLNAMRGELLQAYEAALRKRYSVSIDQQALAKLMEQQAQ